MGSFQYYVYDDKGERTIDTSFLDARGAQDYFILFYFRVWRRFYGDVLSRENPDKLIVGATQNVFL